MKFLVVNADDFGYTHGVNKGIIKAHTKGIVTSTSLMVYGKAVAEAKELSAFPRLSVGLHFQITGEGLLNVGIQKKVFLPLSSTQRIKKEFSKQVDEFAKIVGKKPTHLDSHHNVHSHPKVKPIFEEYSKKHSVPIRHFSGVKFIEDFFGWDDSRVTDPSRIGTDSLLHILSRLDDDISELLCHPGIVDQELRNITKYADERSAELQTLTDKRVMEQIRRSKIQLVNWSEAWTIKKSTA